jgi:hypothetical protein
LNYSITSSAWARSTKALTERENQRTQSVSVSEFRVLFAVFRAFGELASLLLIASLLTLAFILATKKDN